MIYLIGIMDTIVPLSHTIKLTSPSEIRGTKCQTPRLHEFRFSICRDIVLIYLLIYLASFRKFSFV